MHTINHQLVEMALDRTDGSSFERFAQSFFAALAGVNFVPLGGHHDGGAEAFTEPGVFDSKRPGHFWQASTEKTLRRKIRLTVRRIREFGRDPNQLTYCTSIVVPNIDNEEDLLSDELNVRVKIRDQKFIISQINHSPQTVAAFNSYLAPHLAFLKEMGGVTMLSHSNDLPARSLCVFLGQEVERRRGNAELLETVTDSLILWALEGTDPDKEKFMTRAQILERITAALPAAKQFISGVLDTRLQALAAKDNTYGREVRWHRKEDLFCLPYETRTLIEAENTEDELLKASVSGVFRLRAAAILKDDNEIALISKVVAICHRALEITFEKQGFEVAAFVLGNEEDEQIQYTIADHIDQALDEFNEIEDERGILKDAALFVLRGAFYKSEEPERLYLTKLSRTYTLLFVLKNEPRVVEYFRRMSGDFVLYIGSDLFIRALSEHNLADQDRMTWNMFKILQAAGAELILTEKTLEEIISHIRAADHEFKNHYAEMEQYIDLILARHIDRILIRSYFYAKFDEEGRRQLTSWGSFIGQFCTYQNLHSGAGKESMRRYLCEEFGLVYETLETMLKNIDGEELEALKEKIIDVRDKGRRQREETLCYNDALQVLRVYEKRRELGEGSKPNPFGYRTWWLTQETYVRKATPEIIRKHGGARYMMRPEFVLNFIAIAPSAEEVRKSYGTIFPSLLGVKLSNRLRNDAFQTVITKIKEASKFGEARARSLASELSDQLKGDQFKRYEVGFKSGQE
jgi:hypothetical protein